MPIYKVVLTNKKYMIRTSVVMASDKYMAIAKTKQIHKWENETGTAKVTEVATEEEVYRYE